MSGSQSSITVLNELPMFTGNPKPGETPFKNELDARTFLRSVETYFHTHNITDNDQKVAILFNRVEKVRGDAIKLVTSFSGKNPEFSEVKDIFLAMYPTSICSFQDAVKAYFGTTIDPKWAFNSMTGVESISQAVAENYICENYLTHGEFDEGTIILRPPPAIPVTAPPPTPPPTSQASGDTTSKKSSDSTTSGSTTSQEPPPATPPRTSRQATSSRDPPLTLMKILHNFAMQLLLAKETEYKVYKRLSTIGPRTSSTKLMGESVKIMEQFKTRNSTKKPPPKTNEFIWQASFQPNPRDQPNRTEQRPPTQEPLRRGTSTPYQQTAQSSSKIQCYNCKEVGHTRKDCNLCGYCKARGHNYRECKKRIAESRGKYCQFCRLKDSHDTKECRKKKAYGPTNHVRMVQTEPHSETQQEDWVQPYASNVYEEWTPSSGDSSDSGPPF